MTKEIKKTKIDNNDFLLSLRQELINTQNLRFKFTFQKLIFIISLLGVGSISSGLTGMTGLKNLIYFVPFASFMFDFYIIGENFGIRRIGTYLKFSDKISNQEKYWEYLLNIPKNVNRDLFAIHGNVYSTIISILLSTFMILVTIEEKTGDIIWNLSTLNIAWIILVVIASLTSWIIYPIIMNNRLLRFKISLNKNYSDWETKIEDERSKLSNFNGKKRKDFKRIKNDILKIYNNTESDSFWNKMRKIFK